MSFSLDPIALLKQFIPFEDLPIFTELIRWAELVIAEVGPLAAEPILIQVFTEMAAQKAAHFYDDKLLELGLSGGPGLDPEKIASVAGHGGVAGGHSGPKGGTIFIDGPKGFLWKPVSETRSTLVVLTTGKSGGRIFRATRNGDNWVKGDQIDKGNFASIANGGRHHYRFKKSGAAYGPGAVFYEDVLIEHPEKRTESKNK